MSLSFTLEAGGKESLAVCSDVIAQPPKRLILSPGGMSGASLPVGSQQGIG